MNEDEDFIARVILTSRKLLHWPPGNALKLLGFVLMSCLMVAGYLHTSKPVTILIDGHAYHVRTHQASVEALLREKAFLLHREDAIWPPLDSPLVSGQTVHIRRARPVTFYVDGQVLQLRTLADSLSELLREASLSLKRGDKVLFNGIPVSSHELLFPGSGGHLASQGWPMRVDPPSPLEIQIRRSVPIYLYEGEVPATIYTAEETVGEALLAAGMVLRLGDEVWPGLETPVRAGLRVHIRRSRPVSIWVDGRHIETRALPGSTVGEVLAQEGVALVGKDRVEPAEDTPVTPGMVIRVTRVREEVLIEQEPIPFETVWKPDSELEIDQRRVVQGGKEGLLKRRVRIIYEDGQEKERTVEDEWVDREPVERVIAYGTKIVIRELQTPEGPLRYWRKMRVLITSYTAATCGKSKDHPLYGITRLGWRATKGVIAVDPRVINFGTRIYVPGYGLGIAVDTGGKIKGRHIDLAYDEDDLKLWYKWEDIYLLAPPPPRDQIRWILPDWPRERRRR